MPKYKKKITNLMDYQDFKKGVENLPIMKRAFLSVLFFAGCRVSEALALTTDNIHCTQDTIFIQFTRLKGSKQTDPQEVPRDDALIWLCGKYDPRFSDFLFPFSRTTAWRLVKSCFPNLYPHYFRMNRITKVADQFGDSTVYHLFGITASSIDHYRGKVDIKRVGKALQEEIA